MRLSATSVCGFQLLVYEAFRYKCLTGCVARLPSAQTYLQPNVPLTKPVCTQRFRYCLFKSMCLLCSSIVSVTRAFLAVLVSAKPSFRSDLVREITAVLSLSLCSFLVFFYTHAKLSFSLSFSLSVSFSHSHAHTHSLTHTCTCTCAHTNK